MLSNIKDKNLNELKTLYREYFNTNYIPKSRALLERSICYKLQEKKYGKLKKKHKEKLTNILTAKDKPKIKYNLQIGEKISKTYNGKQYEIIIGNNKFFYQNTEYKSLSRVAKLITGKHLSGPLFFNLRSRSHA